MPLNRILPLLPLPLRKEIAETVRPLTARGIHMSEIRLRQGRIASLSYFCGGTLANRPLSFVAEESDLKSVLSLAVGGSVYAHEQKLSEGYLTMEGGIRIGVAGRVLREGSGTLRVTALDSLVFRLPAGMPSADALFSFYLKSQGGILLFAPPGGGKTSLLRAFLALAAKRERVALIDSREEFSFSDKQLLLDHLRGYPKAIGAEIAVRTLSPELLVLDEIGAEEANAVASLVSFGVRTVAALHADNAETLLASRALSPLLVSGLFSHLWEVKTAQARSLSGGTA